MSDKAVPAQKDFSKAQTKHFNELQAEFTRAQKALQTFTNYLSEEHELDQCVMPAGWGWQIGPKGFVAVATQQQGMPVEPAPSEESPAPQE